MELSIVQMKDMLSIQQQELLRRQLLYMLNFEKVHEMKPGPQYLCLYLSTIGRTFSPNST